ncbi:MAG: Bax inhibitor-1/YccA family protein [Alphaproteobacteria bacterium]|nr:Bax inhibitor-1/YccA family protein [Alphaproteobacteria bacterium]
MITKKSVIRDTTARNVSGRGNDGGINKYLKRIFALMFGAVGLTAVAAYMTIWGGGLQYLINFQTGSMSGLYYILLFGGLGLAIWAQVRVFSMRPTTAAWLLALYAVLIGVTMTPLIAISLAVNPASILLAFIVASLMFGCMALFGYKTVKDLSFLGTFLFIGMIGLIIIGLLSFIWPAMMGGTFGTIVCFIGVLVFALFTAYDMQTLKRAYAVIGDETQQNQLAVLGALHLYISFIAMFQYLLSLFNRE